MTDLKSDSATQFIGSNKKAYALQIKFATIERFLLLLVLYTSPMHKVAWDVGIRIRIEYICAGLLLVLGVTRFLRGQFRLLNFSTPVFGHIICIVFSMLAPISNVVDYPQYLKGVLALLISLYVTTYFLQHVKDPKTVELFWDHWWKAGLLMAVYGLIQWGLWWFFRVNLDEVILEKIILNPRKTGLDAYMVNVSRITSLTLDTNNFSLYLSTVLPIGIYRVISATTLRKRFSALFLTGLIVLTNVLTLSRSGWGGLIIASLLLFPLFGLVSLRSRRLRSGVLILVIAGFFIAILLLVAFSPAYWEEVIRARLGASRGTFLHFQLLADSLDLFLRSPLIGWGINQFGPLYTRYYRPDLPPIWNTHNGFVTIGIDMGLFGLLGYGGLFVYTIRLALRALTKIPSRRLLGLFLFWGYLAYLMANLGYNSFGFTNFWVYQALLIASASVWLKERQHDRQAVFS